MIQKVITKEPRLMKKQMKLLKNFLNYFLRDIKTIWKHQWELVILSLVVLMFQNITQSWKRNHEKQVSFLMIPKGKGWNYIALKKLSPLLTGITSKNHRNFYCQNCPHSFATEKNMNLIKKYVEIKISATLQYLLKALK